MSAGVHIDFFKELFALHYFWDSLSIWSRSNPLRARYKIIKSPLVCSQWVRLPLQWRLELSLFLLFIRSYLFVVKLGSKHPDPVVETASLSSVEPTDVWYDLSLPENTIKTGALSALQLEAVTYASQQHEHLLPDGSRAGFLIGNLILNCCVK